MSVHIVEILLYKIEIQGAMLSTVEVRVKNPNRIPETSG